MHIRPIIMLVTLSSIMVRKIHDMDLIINTPTTANNMRKEQVSAYHSRNIQ